MGWGTEVESAFSLVIFLYVPTEVRLRRLEQGELKTFGKVNPGVFAMGGAVRRRHRGRAKPGQA